MPPRVFVLIPTYNISAFVEEAIESVMAQTFQDWELLVLDDCSTDNTAEVVARWVDKDARIRYVKNEKNLGMLKNWNKGISYCRSTYFAKLDGDDKWHPDMVQSALNLLEQDPTVGIIFSKYVSLDPQGGVADRGEMILPDFAEDKSFSCTPLVQQGVSKMLSYSILRQGMSLMRSKIFLELGGYRLLLTEDTQASTDTEFYFRIGCHYRIHCINQVLYYYRRHLQSISAKDMADGLAEQKMYEVKTVINDYYYSQKKIEAKQWKKNKVEIDFRYKLFLNYQYRQRKQFLKTVRLSLKILFNYPTQSLHYYLNRINQLGRP
jgi:glycosyltransferase involved in cell wall biosynthesis